MSQQNRGNQLFNKKRPKKKPKKNLNLAALRQSATVQYNYNMKPKFPFYIAKYIAPHQNEPEDLTDDLAPKVSAPSGTTTKQPITQPSTGTDNKLNFKFQKTKPKTPDWTQYQNNFKRLSAASPDTDPEEAQANEQKAQNKDQMATNTEVNTGFDEDVEMKEARELTTSDLSIAVTIEPFQYITTEQVKQIAGALSNQIQEAILKRNGQYVPAFQQKPVQNLGYLPLTCQSAQDLLWLHETIANIPSPIPKTKLTLKPPRSIPQFIKIGMFLPNFSGTLEELKNLLQKQNHWYDMSSWVLINSQKQGDDPASYYLSYWVPENQAHIINNRDRRMAYSLGTVFINIYSKEWNEKLKNSEKDFHFRNIAKHLLVCVVTEPFYYLTLLEVDLIKLALNYRLEKAAYAETDEYMPAFRGHACHYKGGLRLWCESDRDLKWLRDTVASLASPVVGTKLVVSEQTDVPERVKARIFLPSAESEENILKVLKFQNPWADLKSWSLFSTKKCAAGVLFVFYITIAQMRIIKEMRRSNISFLLGEVKVKFDSCYYE